MATLTRLRFVATPTTMPLLGSFTKKLCRQLDHLM